MVRLVFSLCVGFVVVVQVFCQLPGECRDTNASLYRYDVLPGFGWDNIQNKMKGSVIQFSYTNCRLTDDGIYLVPDEVNIFPVKSSDVDQFSQIIEDVNTATSDVAATINLDGTITADHIKINGKFSYDYQKLKSNMINDESIALKVKASYTQYSAITQPGVNLDPSFRSRILSIANHILYNRTASARYESQLVVRDFGTHVITSVDAGASITKVDHVTRDFMQSDSADKSQIAAAAAAELIGVNVGVAVSADVQSKYLAAKTHSSVRTYGGPIYKPINFTINDWIDQIDQNLVAVDRAGDPLHFSINQNLFPELSVSIVKDTASVVESAIRTYYKMNTYPGCTDRYSPNFDYIANIDDGSCMNMINYTYTNFGGLFQTCNVSGDIPGACDKLLTKNPMTGDFSCPTGFDVIPLFRSHENKTETTRTCTKYMIFWNRCETKSYTGTASYQLYWCSNQGETHNDSGYIFGGLYTSQVPNTVTQSMSCPQYFYALSLGEDLSVCVSDDYENAFEFSVPFDGFFSCQNKNPSATSQNKTNCQVGFNAHLATIIDDCEINYCAKITPRNLTFVPIRSPPFSRMPLDQDVTSVHMVADNGYSWTQLFQVPVGFSGFNGTNSSWILDSGDFLDNRDLLMTKETANGGLKGNQRSLGAIKQNMKEQRRNVNDQDGEIPSSEVLALVGGTVGIILSLVIFITVVVYVLSRGKKKNNKISDIYVKKA